MSKETKEVVKEAVVNKFTKKQIMASKTFKDYYVLRELLKDDVLYSTAEVKQILKPFGGVK